MSEQEQAKRSKVEFIKEESVGLRSKILTELANASTGEVTGDCFKLHRQPGESLGDIFNRYGIEAIQTFASAKSEQQSSP